MKSKLSPWWPPEVAVERRRPTYICFGLDFGPFNLGFAIGFGPEGDFRLALYLLLWKILITQNGYTAWGSDETP